MIKCPECGFENLDNAYFCSQCATQVSWPDPGKEEAYLVYPEPIGGGVEKSYLTKSEFKRYLILFGVPWAIVMVIITVWTRALCLGVFWTGLGLLLIFVWWLRGRELSGRS